MTKEKWTMITELLGGDNVDRIKTELTDMIIENLRESVEEYYLITPEDINEDIVKIVESAQKEVVKTRREEVKGKAMKVFNDYVDGILKMIEESK